MQLQILVDFYKKTAKDWIDRVSIYETVTCNHLIDYVSSEVGILKVHRFSIQIDDMSELEIIVTVNQQNPSSVLKWQIKHQYVPMSETYIFLENGISCDEESLLKYIAQCGNELIGFSAEMTYVAAGFDRGAN